MSLLLCIDCSTTHASVALAKDEELILLKTNLNLKDHAAFIQPAIVEIMHETNYKLSDVDAIAVTSGPGSYTGLRVGFASAKGLCYSLKIPLLTMHTTFVMSRAILNCLKSKGTITDDFYICPLIDARRLDVFTAVYTKDLNTILKPCAITLNKESYSEYLNTPVYFSGNGVEKWQLLCTHPNAHFITINWWASDMIPEAFRLFNEKLYTPLALSEPEYIKEFYFPQN